MHLPDLIPTGRRPQQAAQEEAAPARATAEARGREKPKAGQAEFGLLLEAAALAAAPPPARNPEAMPAPTTTVEQSVGRVAWSSSGRSSSQSTADSGETAIRNALP